MCVFVEDVGAFVSASVGSLAFQRLCGAMTTAMFLFALKSLLDCVWKSEEEADDSDPGREVPKNVIFLFSSSSIYLFSRFHWQWQQQAACLILEKTKTFKYLACLVYVRDHSKICALPHRTDVCWWRLMRFCLLPTLMWSHWAFERRIFVFASSHSRLNDKQSESNKTTNHSPNVLRLFFFFFYNALAQQIRNWVFHYAINLI